MTNLTADKSISSGSFSDLPIRGEFQKLLIGGLGGTAPIIATLMTGELQNTVGSEESAHIYNAGVVLRAVLFFSVGAFIVWLHESVRTRSAIFQLGIAAPALFVAMVHSTQAQSAEFQYNVNYSAGEIYDTYQANADQNDMLSDILGPSIIFGECSIVDGLLGRKCK